jgi:hypothetical protein
MTSAQMLEVFRIRDEARALWEETATQPAHLTSPEIQMGTGRLQKWIEEVKQFDPQTVTEQNNIQVYNSLEERELRCRREP